MSRLWLSIAGLVASALAVCPTEVNCQHVSCQFTSCSSSNGCGTYTCDSCGTGAIDRGDCNPTPAPPTPPVSPTPPTPAPIPCDPAVWGNFASCSEVQQKCRSTTCNSGGTAYGKYVCNDNGCNGWYCPDPPCTQDLVCAPIQAHADDKDLCMSLNEQCVQQGLGNLVYSDTSFDSSNPDAKGTYQCFRCGKPAAVTAPSSGGDKSDAAKDWGLVFTFAGVFIGICFVLYVLAFLAGKCFADAKETAPLSCKRQLVSLLGTLDEHGHLESCWYYFVNNHELFRLSCLRDDGRMSRNLALRESISGFFVSLGLSLVFAGIDTNRAVMSGCAFDGRDGFTASASTYQADASGGASFSMDYLTTAIVTALGMVVGVGTGKVVSTTWDITKPAKNCVLPSVIIELTWLAISVFCVVVEQRLASSAQVDNKYQVYFTTAVTAKAVSLLAAGPAVLVGKYIVSIFLLGGKQTETYQKF